MLFFSQVVGAIIFQPINRALPLRCLEEKYGLSSHHKEATLTAHEKRNQKRLSLNITNGHLHDKQNIQDELPCQDNGLMKGQHLRSGHTAQHTGKRVQGCEKQTEREVQSLKKHDSLPSAVYLQANTG